MMFRADRYFAAPASDNAENLLWYVADSQYGKLNVTNKLIPEFEGCLPFLSREIATLIAAKANQINVKISHGEGDPS